MTALTNEEAAAAGTLFEKLEGIDIHPAAAVAAASLISAVELGQVPTDGIIMLNITGGGEVRLQRSRKELIFLKPSLITERDISIEELGRRLMEIL
jgi:cysteate synthase